MPIPGELVKSIVKHLLGSFAAALALLAAGLVIWCFRRASGSALKDVLFCVGAAPIALFAIGQMGRFARRGDSVHHVSRPQAGSSSSHRRDSQGAGDVKTIAGSSLTWILAGLWVWLLVCVV